MHLYLSTTRDEIYEIIKVFKVEIQNQKKKGNASNQNLLTFEDDVIIYQRLSPNAPKSIG